MALLLAIAGITCGQGKNLTTCNGGYGFAGDCASTTTLFRELPDFCDAKVFFEDVLLTVSQQWFNPSVCIGDFSPSRFPIFDSDLYNAGCWYIPLPDSTTTGVVSFFGEPPCAGGGSASFCLTFDYCGSAAISINKPMMDCVASMGSGTGLTPLLSALSPGLKQMAVGLSSERRFAKTFNVALPMEDKACVEEVTVQGHYFDTTVLSLPTTWHIGKFSLSDILEFSGTTTRIVDFSNVDPFLESLSSLDSAEEAVDVLAKLTSATEQYANLAGMLEIKFDKLTKNFLKAFKFRVDGVNVLISNGGGTTGVGAGVYLYLDTNVCDSLQVAVETFVFHFSGFFDKLGIQVPTLAPSNNAGMGIFVTSRAAGFSIQGFGFNVYCTFRFPQQNGDLPKASCNFGGDWLSALWNGYKWVFKEAEGFFDDAGKEIARITGDVVDFTADIVDKGKDTAEKVDCFFSKTIFGKSCGGKSGGGARPGDHTIYIFQSEKTGKCLAANMACNVTDYSAVISSNFAVLNCRPYWTDCRAEWSQMWQFTEDLKLCNVLLQNFEYSVKYVEDNNACLTINQMDWVDDRLYFRPEKEARPWRIRKVRTERFKFFPCEQDYDCTSSIENANGRTKVYHYRADGSWAKQNGDSQFKI
ncbi:hypothetical protein QOT17_020011 [Balamuthia mandrillaris]